MNGLVSLKLSKLLNIHFYQILSICISNSNFRNPFSRQTILDYFLELIILFGVGCSYYITIIVSLCTFFMSCHFFFDAGCLQLKRTFVEIDELSAQSVKSNVKKCEILFVGLVKHHNKLKGYSRDDKYVLLFNYFH